MGWGIEGYIELNPDWKENREAIAAEAAAEEAEVTEAAGGVWPGVAGDPSEGMAVLLLVLSWCLVLPPTLVPLPPPAPLAEESAPFGVNPPRPPPPLPPATAEEFVVVVVCSADEVPWRSVTPPLAVLEDEPALLCELPLSRFWFRSFSSRLHLALRLENQTCVQKNKSTYKIF